MTQKTRYYTLTWLMHSIFIRYLVFVIFIFYFSFSIFHFPFSIPSKVRSGYAYAAKQSPAIKEKKGLLAKIKNKIEAQKEKLFHKKREEKRVLNQISVIDSNLEKVNKDLYHTQLNLQQNLTKQTYLKQKLIESEKRFDKYKEVYKERLVAFYKSGNVGYLEVLFNASNFSDFTNRIEYVQYVVSNDINVLRGLEEKRHEIEAIKDEVEEAGLKIQRLKTQIEGQKDKIATEKKEKVYLLSRIQKEKELYIQSIRELETESRKIEEFIRRSQRARAGTRFTGRLVMPVNAGITSGFGHRFHPIFKVRAMHTGVDFSASYGTAIHAAENGTVVWAGWGRGYGKMVVIQHSGDISTLYAHGSRILVSVGQEVRQGDVVMLSGSTGNSTGPHLHFEVRKNGTPVNPMNYF